MILLSSQIMSTNYCVYARWNPVHWKSSTTYFKSSYYRLHQINQIRDNFTEHTCTMLVNSLVLSTLNFINCLVVGFCCSNNNKNSKCKHITPALKYVFGCQLDFELTITGSFAWFFVCSQFFIMYFVDPNGDKSTTVLGYRRLNTLYSYMLYWHFIVLFWVHLYML